MKNLFANLCLLLVACVAGLTLCEVSLRLFYPKYRLLADPQFRQDARVIYAHKPNARSWASHPDTGVLHSFHHNNLALRQNRNFTEADLASATNIGVFGDSFVENIGLAAPYSFTEPLDWLLNQHGERVNVLNFGVYGYGTGQSFLHYEGFRHAADLDHVVYVYCTNDLGDLFDNGLFDLDAAGRLVENRAIPSSGWVRLISRWHLSYLLLDGSGRFSSFIGERATSGKGPKNRGAHHGENILPLSDRNKDAYKLAVFREVIRRWTHLVEHNGSTFSVVLLPDNPPQPSVVALLSAEGVDVIDLSGCFGNADSAQNRRTWMQSSYHFENDWHWNEAGNQLAAVCLYRVLEEKMRLPALSEEDLQAALHRYYAAFEGWMPHTPRIPVSLRTTTDIREKYNQLGTLASTREERRALTSAPRTRVLAADFDVYLDGRRVVYVKEGCRPTDLQPLIFLSLVPVDGNDLPRSRIPHGYERARFMLRFGIDRGHCLVTAELPDYPIRFLWTGEYSQDGDLLWQGGFPIDPDTSGDAGKDSYSRPDTPMIASDFDVYLDGRYLVYVNEECFEECFASDQEAYIFLHIVPVDQDALPPDRVQYGFDNLDFRYSVFESRELGCRTMRRLPDYAIRHIRTGQYVKDDQGTPVVLWEGEFHIAQGAEVEEGGP